MLGVLLLSGCAETDLPDLTIPAGEGTRLGIDTRGGNYTFGLHVTDPLHQRSP